MISNAYAVPPVGSGFFPVIHAAVKRDAGRNDYERFTVLHWMKVQPRCVGTGVDGRDNPRVKLGDGHDS